MRWYVTLFSACLLAGPALAQKPECERLAARIAKRRAFLTIRLQERLHYPSMPTFSPYCESHPKDEDCALPQSAQEDISRDVSELSVGDGETPETDAVLVPLLRQQREQHCTP